ncbi:phosphatidylinositol 4,5-bisphosphate 5-phosphatase A isoform X1 [Ornithorhynchus anatinus]|uniref:Phosphatidylinositol 4,5-bisphosphate 5-phosphatase A n=2 Tax=Ornithorhynchus anatinus TaxID=9258 RepID=F6YVK8_ORNAN|nr:phosphatidylinositol 4,5-bisphosphate 5-phosphatase A isoform X1 [Ornithorhynchus anatinus]
MEMERRPRQEQQQRQRSGSASGRQRCPEGAKPACLPSLGEAMDQPGGSLPKVEPGNPKVTKHQVSSSSSGQSTAPTSSGLSPAPPSPEQQPSVSLMSQRVSLTSWPPGPAPSSVEPCPSPSSMGKGLKRDPVLPSSRLILAPPSCEQHPPSVEQGQAPSSSSPLTPEPVSAPCSMGWTPIVPWDSRSSRSPSTPSPVACEGLTPLAAPVQARCPPSPSPAGAPVPQRPGQMPPEPPLSLSFRARPECSRSTGFEDSLLPRPPQPLPLDSGRGHSEGSGHHPGAGPPVLLSPVTFKPAGPSAAITVPPPPKPTHSPSRSPGGSPSPSTSLATTPRPFGQLAPPPPIPASPTSSPDGAAPGGRISPSPHSLDLPAPFDSPCSEPLWSAHSTCKGDPGFRITVVTWNVGTAMPPDDVTSLLHLNTDESSTTDMIAIGLQEVNSMINKRLKDALFTDQWSELFMEVLAPFNFVLVSTVRMQGVILLVFAKYYHLPFLQNVQTDCTRTGLGGYWGNKGGVSVRLSIFGHMVCFLNCHLPAHMDKAEQRKDNFMTILNMQQFEGPTAHGILDHDIVFWFGDLNFRIESYDLHFVKFAIDNNKLHQLWEKDQLNMAKSSWPVLKGFQEGPLTFAPTFKFDVGTNKYDTSAKKRKPAWTDRILWKIKTPGGGPSPSGRERQRLQVTQHSYCSHMEFTVSDHKPVVALFALQFAYRDDVPLVRIQVADEWLRPEQAVVRYRMENVFLRSSWDWIGLYRVGFRHCKDYVAYVWAKHEDVDGNSYQVTFSEESLPKGRGEFILGYYSHSHNILIGVTDPFQISLPASEEGSSPTDSSHTSSDGEDNSTMELLGPKSRSPSPGKMKRQRSRSPGLAKFPGLILRASSRERGASRSPSPQGRTGPLRPAWGQERGQTGTSCQDDGARGLETPRPLNFSIPASLPRPVPHNLGLLPALRLETVGQVMGQWHGESPDQDCQISPKSPSALARSLSPSPKGSWGKSLGDGGLGP